MKNKTFNIQNLFIRSAEMNKHRVEFGHVKNIKRLEVETYIDFRKSVMFPISYELSSDDIAKLKGDSLNIIIYNSTMITVDSLEGMAQDKNPQEMPTSEEADTWIEGEEVLYTYPGLEKPIRYPKDMYIKYFWLFYIVAVDFWEKYPQHVYIGNKPFTVHKDLATINRLATYKSRFYAAITEAKRNLPWAQEAEKMVEEKKK